MWTFVDYVLVRKNDMKAVKVIPGEECVPQHKLVKKYKEEGKRYEG